MGFESLATSFSGPHFGKHLKQVVYTVKINTWTIRNEKPKTAEAVTAYVLIWGSRELEYALLLFFWGGGKEGSLPCSEKLTIRPYPEPVESLHLFKSYFSKIHFNAAYQVISSVKIFRPYEAHHYVMSFLLSLPFS